MPYLVLGEDGRVSVDSATRAASEIFGLGRRKKSFFKRRMARKLRIAKRLAPLMPPAALLVAASRRGRKRRRGGEPPAALVAPAGPIPDVAPEGEPIPEESVEEAPIDERVAAQEAPPGAPPAAEAAEAPEADEAPESAEPDEEESVEEAPETSVEGGGCGGYILTAPSPKQRDYVRRRSKAASLDTPPYKGLGQDEDFWFEPEWAFKRTVPASAWPPSATSVHAGSPVWGSALEAQWHDPFGKGASPPF
jgi:ribosomal protein L12E/L44/L45/RPP1/RPP2